MIKLFYASDTCSLASHIALEDAGADYSTARISFASADLLFRVMTIKRWELIRAMAGAGPLTIRGAR